ncbi:MAG: septum formation initiator family protein [Deltaproteobacteria bacterium]|nr:septum formation initiator family protein [Deltaproteobacteria bacterium]
MKNSAPKKKSARPRGQLTPFLKRVFVGGVFFIIAGFGLLTLFSRNGILDLVRLKTLSRSLQNENTGLMKQQEELRAEVQRLQDPRYLEYLARERFGYMRPNEVFILLDTPQGDSAPSPQSTVDN